MVTTIEYKFDNERTLEFGWMMFVNRAVFLRAMAVAVAIGSVLTFINQPGWVEGSEVLQLLPLILVFVTPFVVVTISQVAGVRQAYIDAVTYAAPAKPERLIATAVSHEIPARAMAIGLAFGSVNAIVVLADALLHSGDFAAVPIALLGQAYVLPVLFGLLSQAISYRRARFSVAKA